MIDLQRLAAAYRTVRDDLLDHRVPAGHWEGRLASSPLSTATAVSALVLAEQHFRPSPDEYHPEEVFQNDLSELVVQSLHWLAQHQNDDGGWGDTDRSRSNIATTMLVQAAFHLTGVPVKYAGLLERAAEYVKKQGGIPGLRRRYGKDKTFAVPILTNCALAELVSWKQVPALPFELACVPQSLYRHLQLPVVSYAIPALVAIGQAKFFHRKPWNPLLRWLRSRSAAPSLKVLERMQPASGGFLEATPLTSFVVMSLASIGQADHKVTRQGIEFLLASVRPDGSWAIDTNLATWNTTLALNALHAAGEDASTLGCLPWLLDCQHREQHPYTSAEPGGWAWTDLSGGVPDADDTPGALLALRAHWEASHEEQRQRIARAAQAGIGWLLDLQNRDGGWPTFCRGWGHLPFDRSGADLTAHVLRAFRAWRDSLSGLLEATGDAEPQFDLRERIERATASGLQFLQSTQRTDGSWVPLWFGNQHLPGEENPIYGTARVLAALRNLKQLETPMARRGIEWLTGAQKRDGGWGGGCSAVQAGYSSQASSVEETALATDALLGCPGVAEEVADKGLAWLIAAVEDGSVRESAPIGFYFAKLWYYEALYPRIFAVGALGRALAMRTSDPAFHPAHLSTS